MAAESTNNSASAMAQASAPIRLETISMPGMASPTDNSEFDPRKWKVRYLKVNADDPEGLMMLELLETQGMVATQIVVLNKTGWTFTDQYYMLVTYLEKLPSN